MRTDILNKKGQLEIGIKIMVLIVFLVLLIISLIVYFRFSYSSLRETKEEILEEKFSSLVNVIANLPELKCSITNIESECLDARKLVAFGQVLYEDTDVKNNYYEELEINSLVVKIVYPEVAGSIECDESKLINCNVFNLFSLKGDYSDEGLKYTTPVSVYIPDNGKYVIGKLVVTSNA
ncbi:MAG: hypothetical protein KKG75_04885 [Nanoarchaeota archaeon]|nr:hypothetical protein [Nanoarchaeota archaeon]